MLTFFDLVQKHDFRQFVVNRIISNTKKPYCFPNRFPKLCKYRALSLYSIEDIINESFTLSSIGEFNDAFDGAIHQYGTDEERTRAAELKWQELEYHRVNAGLPESVLHHDQFVNPYKNYYKETSRLQFRELDYLGTYVGCLSEENTSTLMWAHYADSNKGMCIEYDFNQLPADAIIRKMLFPVVYTDTPIHVSDLMNDTNHSIYDYSMDAAVLCSALNKANIWSYEREWRLIMVWTTLREKTRRFPILLHIQPSNIYFGYHFLKHFFYYDKVSSDERDQYKALFKSFLNLLSYLKEKAVPIAIMVPDVGSYSFKPITISADDFQAFMHEEFDEDSPENMRYYYTVHDHLMDLLEKPQEENHA